MKNTYFLITIQAMILSFMFILCATLLKNEYLFGWVAHNWMFYIILFVIVLLFTAINKPIIANYSMMGIIIGLYVGNYAGNLLTKWNASKLVEGMSMEQTYRLQHHPGFEIWLSMIVLSFVCGVIYSKRIQN